TTPYAAVTVGTLAVHRVIKGLRNDAPLQGKVTVVIKGGTLVRCPADAAVVDDQVAVALAADSVPFHALHITQAEPDKTDNHIVCADADRVIADADAVTRCRLPRNGHIV